MTNTMSLQETSPAHRRPSSEDAWRLAGAGRPRLLCVDDDANILEGLQFHLERPYRLSMATSGAEALELLDREGPCAIVVSDMRMPNMDGATFLGKVRESFPDTVRLLLTGQTDIEAAIAAVNEGQVFRFLTKPCPLPQLLGALRAATEQYRLTTAERVLLEMTLHGSVKALTDVLALTHPLAFARSMRLRQSVTALAEQVDMRERWHVELAAMLSQLGCVMLPAKTVEKLHYGHDLSPEEQKQVAELPGVAERLLGPIPRLEKVRAILVGCADGKRLASSNQKNEDEIEKKGIQMLRIASDYDTLESRGLGLSVALDTMRARGNYYDPILLAAFAELRGSTRSEQTIKEVLLSKLEIGMILAEDICLQNGLTLAGRGYEVTMQFIERARKWQAQAVNKAVKVSSRNR